MLNIEKFALTTILATVEPTILRAVTGRAAEMEAQEINKNPLLLYLPLVQNLLFGALAVYGIWKSAFPVPETFLICLAIANGVAVLIKVMADPVPEGGYQMPLPRPRCTVEDVVQADRDREQVVRQDLRETNGKILETLRKYAGQKKKANESVASMSAALNTAREARSQVEKLGVQLEQAQQLLDLEQADLDLKQLVALHSDMARWLPIQVALCEQS